MRQLVHLLRAGADEVKKSPKDFNDFLVNHWPHLVAKVDLNTKLLFCVVASIIGGAVAVIVAG